jgi:hypothetical protein
VPTGDLVQFNVRLDQALRRRIRCAARIWGMTERELVEAWARELPPDLPPRRGMPWHP